MYSTSETPTLAHFLLFSFLFHLCRPPYPLHHIRWKIFHDFMTYLSRDASLMLLYFFIESTGSNVCPRTFDGWGCWDDTPANSTAFTPCPTFMPGFLPDRKAFKVCLEDGSWFRHPLTNKTWSNYTTCIDQEDLSFRQKINNVYISGYTISVIALLISLAIFFSFT